MKKLILLSLLSLFLMNISVAAGGGKQDPRLLRALGITQCDPRKPSEWMRLLVETNFGEEIRFNPHNKEELTSAIASIKKEMGKTNFNPNLSTITISLDNICLFFPIFQGLIHGEQLAKAQEGRLRSITLSLREFDSKNELDPTTGRKMPREYNAADVLEALANGLNFQ